MVKGNGNVSKIQKQYYRRNIMKKIIAMLLALVMVLGLAACASKTEPAQTEEPAATETTPAAEETTEEPAETTEEPATTEATGSVYYLNFKPEAEARCFLHRADRCSRQGRHRCFRHLRHHPRRRAGQELRSDPLPVRQPGRHQLLRRLLLSAGRHRHHGPDDHRRLQPQG